MNIRVLRCLSTFALLVICGYVCGCRAPTVFHVKNLSGEGLQNAMVKCSEQNISIFFHKTEIVMTDANGVAICKLRGSVLSIAGLEGYSPERFGCRPGETNVVTLIRRGSEKDFPSQFYVDENVTFSSRWNEYIKEKGSVP